MFKLAVYGTLRKDYWNHRYISEQGGKFVKTERLQGFNMYGKLIPCVVPSDNKEDSVFVEIYELEDEALPRIDMLEGYREGDKDNIYNRITVETSVGPAYMYVVGEEYASTYGGSNARKVADGVYRSGV